MNMTNVLYHDCLSLFKFLGISENTLKNDNVNIILLYYIQKHNNKYAFLTDQYCDACIELYNDLEHNKYYSIDITINAFAYHLTRDHHDPFHK